MVPDALPPSAHELLAALRAVEAQGWYVESYDASTGLNAVRPRFGTVTAHTPGGLLSAIALREEEYDEAHLRAVRAGCYFYGFDSGRGWSGLRPTEDGGRLVVAHSLGDFLPEHASPGACAADVFAGGG